MNKYCFKVYLDYDEQITYISAESKRDAERELKYYYWPDVIDYKFLGIE